MTPASLHESADYSAAYTKMVERRALQRDQLEQSMLDLLARRGPQYCVEAGRMLGVSLSRARTTLKVLERVGLLTSWMEPSSRSGQGRRFYRLVYELAPARRRRIYARPGRPSSPQVAS